ncbi:MAG: hypothetical protein IPG42_04875 [Betaproteobacteria bacterium]|nr:hypothetical protein [Betaproteobacteria bacterium]
MLLRLIVSIVALIVSERAQVTKLFRLINDAVHQMTWSKSAFTRVIQSQLMTLNQFIAENPQNPELLLRKDPSKSLGSAWQSIDVFPALRAESTEPSSCALHQFGLILAQQGRLED